MINQWLLGEVTIRFSTVPVAKGAESNRSPGPQLEGAGLEYCSQHTPEENQAQRGQ